MSEDLRDVPLTPPADQRVNGRPTPEQERNVDQDHYRRNAVDNWRRLGLSSWRPTGRSSSR